MVKLGNDWDEKIGKEFEKEYYLKLRNFLKEEYTSHTVFPDMYDLFSALKATPYSKVKVVILGQDPYHEPGQAHGMAFSVKPGVQIPPSLLNMYKEINSEFGYPIPRTGYLMKWAEQGVLLLNTVLTVREASPNSHKGKGWESFTDRVIAELNRKATPVVFLLWGANAKNKAKIITNPIHKKLETVHPSPLSAYGGFFGCKHFSRCNQILIESGQKPIDWQI